ncbi:hypothetical protein [Streptomyces sp. DH24]|uniref:hypothetical protein n=1 Tax=Streptomyces sp. DH24 TaxID=3040123 RepID=UPI0024415D8D|nr:hypothetical protein [Streptomyces sp. DH24]MDG9719177.1 hypothetical protein [Streptomyces sp. DH24]
MPSPTPRIRTRRNTRPVPAPRASSEAEELPAGPAEQAAGPPQPPHRRRVRMLVDVVDHPDEVAYATVLFEERGWSVRPAEPAEAAPRAEHRAALIVEVRLHGARLGAVRTAVAQLELLARQAELGAWVRDAALVEHERGPRTTYHVHRAPPSGGRLRPAAARLWARLGGADEQRAVTVPAGPNSREAAGAELAARDLGGRAFDPARHALRVPGHSDENPPLARTPQERRVHRAWLVAGAVGIVLAVACGMYVTWADGWWKLPPALLSTAGALPLGRTAKETRDRSRAAQWATGVAGTTALAGFGALVGHDVRPGTMWATLLVLALVAFTGTGVALALRRTVFTRHAAWLVPASVPVVWSMVAWLGGQMHDTYLSLFHIPPNVVPAPVTGRYLAAAEPMVLALGSTLFFVALVGWLRHFHLTRDTTYRLFAVVLATLLAVGYALTAKILGNDNAWDAARDAARDVMVRGVTPSDYYGLQGRLVCVRPLKPDEPLAVDNGPVPTDQAVLSFGSTGEWIWLWAPHRRSQDELHSFAVRREDVQLIPALQPKPRCPAG